MTAFNVVVQDGVPFVVRINDTDLLAQQLDQVSAAISAQVAVAAEEADTATRARQGAEAARDIALNTQTVHVWPSISPGAVGFSDGAGRTATGLLGENSPAFTAVVAALAALDAKSIAAQIWPGITAGGIAAIDAAGRTALLLTDTSSAFREMRTEVDAILAGTVGAPVVAPPAVGDLLHFVIHGQSLGTGTAGVPPITTNPVPGGKRASAGVRVADSGSEDPAQWGTIDDLYETRSTIITNQGETIASGCVQRINERLTAELGVTLPDLSQSILVTSTSQGGASIEDLGTAPLYTRLLNAFEWAAGRAAGNNLSYNPLSLLWLQGEANNNDLADTYYAKLKAIWNGAQTKADAMRGYARPLVLTTFQPCEYANGANYDPLAAEAFLWVQERNDFGLFSCPTYHLPPADNVGHLIPAGYKRMGAHYGDALFDFFWGGYKRPVLRPKVERLSARELLLTFDVRPGARLVLDTSAADAKGDTLVQHGIRLVPANDTSYVDNINNPVPPVSINAAVKLSGRNTIYIKAVADIPTGGAYEVRLGWYDCKYRNATHFRDNAGDVLPVFDPTGINTRIHNWVPISRNLIP